MKADLPGTVQRIAHFIGINLDDTLLDIVLRQSSREFMLAHKHQFDEHILRKIGEKRAGLPPAIDASKVTPGNSSHPRHKLTPALKKELDDIWKEQIQSKFGFGNYEDSVRRSKN